MGRFYLLDKKVELLCSWLCSWLCVIVSYLVRSIYWGYSIVYKFVTSCVSHFCIELCYFTFVTFLGFIILRSLKPKTYPSNLRDIDLYFTSVSAMTISSMSSVEMEVFSNAQLMVLTILIFLGGEIFTSMIGLHFKASKVISNTPFKERSRVNSMASLGLPPEGIETVIEMRNITPSTTNTTLVKTSEHEIDVLLKWRSIRVLGFVVLAYMVAIQFLGFIMVFVYVNTIPSSKKTLEEKGLKALIFSIFTTISTFANCGFLPTNEGMMVFRRNSGLLLMLIPQTLLGNTLFPYFLRLSIRLLGKLGKEEEAMYIMKNTEEIGYRHLLPRKHSNYLVGTALGLTLVAFILFCSLDWRLHGLEGMNSYQKIVGVLFQCVNTRHTGESILDISTVAAPTLIVFVVMMYLPSYACFLPNKNQMEDDSEICKKGKTKKRREIILETIKFSQLSYLVIFIMIICVTERKKMKDDPLNFSVFNIVLEVISAYGNVGFSMGYSCERQLIADANCQDKWYGFAGRWSDEGKFVLILVMFFGRLKKFNMDGGKAWKLL